MFPQGRIVKLGGLILAMAVGFAVDLRGSSGPDQGTARLASGRPAFSNQVAARSESTGVFINERELTPAQVFEMMRIYRLPPPRGRFWYDSASGLYGFWGREAAGYIRPGHNFGPLGAHASAGNTRLFMNGRELNWAELMFLQVLFDGRLSPGRIWLDGYTWNMGDEGNPYPLANLRLAIVSRQLLMQRQLQAQQQYVQQPYAQGNSWSWRDGSGTGMASDGNCTMIAVPGADVHSSGCN